MRLRCVLRLVASSLARMFSLPAFVHAACMSLCSLSRGHAALLLQILALGRHRIEEVRESCLQRLSSHWSFLMCTCCCAFWMMLMRMDCIVACFLSGSMVAMPLLLCDARVRSLTGLCGACKS